jgi:hypothetical protein
MQVSKFLPGDRVWYRASSNSPAQGPYIVVKGPSVGTYYLADSNDHKVLALNGIVVNESGLEEAGV